MATTTTSTVQFLGILIAPLMALLVGYVTKASWAERYKALRPLFLLALSALNGFLVEAFAPHPDGYDMRVAIMNAVVAFVIAVATHYGLWRPTGAANAVSEAGVKD